MIDALLGLRDHRMAGPAHSPARRPLTRSAAMKALVLAIAVLVLAAISPA